MGRVRAGDGFAFAFAIGLASTAGALADFFEDGKRGRAGAGKVRAGGAHGGEHAAAWLGVVVEGLCGLGGLPLRFFHGPLNG